MNRLGWWLIFLLVTVAGLMLVMANPQAVEINLYFTRFSQQLGLTLLATLILGLVLAMLAGGGMLLHYRRALKRLRQRYDVVYEEVRNLRRMPIHEA